MDPETVRDLFLALQEQEVEYVLVGALALDVLGMGRFTEDVDLFVRPSEVNIQRLQTALGRVWQDPSIREIEARDLAGEYPIIRYIAPDGFRIDILARLGNTFFFDDLKWVVYSYGGVEVKVCVPETLYQMKKDTVRLQDKADAQRLKQKFLLEE
jgi:hypothetical protein